MNIAALSLAQTPPLMVPLRFFLTAPLFIVLSGIVLLVAEPTALQSRWSPEMLALTHIWVLGVMAMVMFGALQQLLPVLIGVPVAAAKQVSRFSHVMLVAGSGMLIVAMWESWPNAFGVAAGHIVAAVGVFAVAILLSLFRSTSQHATALAMKLSVVALLITTLIGSYLALGHMGGVGLAREWTDIHLSWGLVGWSGLLLIGVAYQVVPMFQITPNYPKRLMKLLAPLLFLLLLLWSMSRLWLSESLLEVVDAALMSLGLALFAVITLRLQLQRRRRLPDTTLNFWRLAMGSLLLALLLVWIDRLTASVPPLLLGVVVIIGLFGAAIIGMLYKIVPFLVWLHLNNRMQAAGLWQGEIPNMKQVIPSLRLHRQFQLYLVMYGVLLALPFWTEWLAVPAGLLLIATGLLLGWNLLAALRLYRHHEVAIAEQARAVETVG